MFRESNKCNLQIFIEEQNVVIKSLYLLREALVTKEVVCTSEEKLLGMFNL